MNQMMSTDVCIRRQAQAELQEIVPDRNSSGAHCGAMSIRERVFLHQPWLSYRYPRFGLGKL